MEAEEEDEGDEQEQQPSQLFLVFHTRPAIIIICRPPNRS